MQKIFLIMMLMFSLTVSAEPLWIFADKSPDNKITYFYDIASIIVKGNIVSMTSMWNYEVVDPAFPEIKSTTWLMEHDCVNKKSRLLIATAFTDETATGNIFDTAKYDDSPWVTKVPNSLGYFEFTFACSFLKK